MIPYNKDNVRLAKILRRNMTPWERKLWYEFLRDCPVRFQRQKAIGSYIVDFYCARARLAIELDGSGHFSGTQPEADEARTAALSELGIRVIRFTNTDISENFSGVCDIINTEISKINVLTEE